MYIETTKPPAIVRANVDKCMANIPDNFWQISDKKQSDKKYLYAAKFHPSGAITVVKCKHGEWVFDRLTNKMP